MSDTDETGQDPAGDTGQEPEPKHKETDDTAGDDKPPVGDGILPDDVWAETPPAARKVLTSLRDARSDAAKYRTQLREVEAERDSLREKLDAAPDPDKLRDDIVAEWSPKVREARVLAAAAGTLRHPSDALKLVDWSEVDPDDTDGIAERIGALRDERPDLAATADPPPRGGTEPNTSTSWARNL